MSSSYHVVICILLSALPSFRALLSQTVITRAVSLGSDSTIPTNRKSASSPRLFASSSTLPKAETGVLDLWKKYPTADGRGVKIAILDTGCDLAAAGLQVTSTGERKYLDFIDCTGDGDVDMTKSAKLQPPNDDRSSNNKNYYTVSGLSGRTLVLGEWTTQATDMTVRIGAVRLFALLPKAVLNRIKQERKKAFEIKQQQSIAEIQLSLDELMSIDSSSSGSKNQSALSNVERKQKIDEHKLLLEQLQESMSNDYIDSGPLMDVVMYQDKNDNVWRVIVDLDACGNLTNVEPMAPYRHEYKFGTLGFGSEVTFCVQVYDNGNLLSIVTDAGSHGTHVAGIAAANFCAADNPPNSPATGSVDDDNGENVTSHHHHQLNGVAPGSQILACKIGDGRVGSSETGAALVRALAAAKRYKCDLINLSFGEPYWQSNNRLAGRRVAQVFDDAVRKWNMAVFTSAGNDGPALSTLGAPGACVSSLITVGAFVSPEMMADQYATLLPPHNGENGGIDPPGASYVFSSRGPTPDGFLPDICAPGGAIAPVPRHTLQGKTQMHGTSMAAPSACGVAACVLSALKQKLPNSTFNPHELKRALVRSATPVVSQDPFFQGSGLVSAPGAVEYALTNHGKKMQNIDIAVSVPSRNNARGIYVRDMVELIGQSTFSVRVLPRFEHALTRTKEELEELLSTELELDLTASEDWVSCPSRMTLLPRPIGQTFSIRIDPAKLSPGVHFATINAVPASDRSQGPIFQLPITVVNPHVTVKEPSYRTAEKEIDGETSTSKTYGEETTIKPNGLDVAMDFDLKPGVPDRRFVTLPAKAEWATIRIKSHEAASAYHDPHNVLLHAVQFTRTDVPNSLIQLKRRLQVKYGVEEELQIRVRGGTTMELCLQLSWLANAAPASVSASIEFHSFDARVPSLLSTQPIRISSATEFGRVEISAPYRPEKLNPKASLRHVHRTIRPNKIEISAASPELDLLPPSDAEKRAESEIANNGTQIYSCRLQYQFKVDEDISVTPRVASLFHQLYDSPIESQLWSLEDSNGYIIGYGGAIHEAASMSLKKNVKYTLELLLRHTDRSILESLKELPLRLAFRLKNELDCPIYFEIEHASTPDVKNDGRKTVKERWVKHGEHRALYITRPTANKIPDWTQHGDIMVGGILLDKNTQATSMDIVYEIPPKAKTNGEGGSENNDKIEGEEKTDEEKEKEDDEDLQSAIFDAKLKQLKEFRLKKKISSYEKLASLLKEEKPSHLPLLTELLSNAKESIKPESVTVEEEDDWRANETITIIDKIVDSIDEDELSRYFGRNQRDMSELQGKELNEAKDEKKKMEEQRESLRSALLSKAATLAKLAGRDIGNDASKERLDLAVNSLKVWSSSRSDYKDDADKDLFSLTIARHEMSKNKFASALSTLRKAVKEQKPNSKLRKEMLKEVISVYESLGMNHWSEHLEQMLFEQFPVAKRKL